MANRLLESAIERVGALAAPLAFDELPDAELLRRFIAKREECAFAAIVRRHGSLVWAVCRSLMHSEADAEDAFQATFLVLVRSASKVRKPNALGAWLHTVAGRVCRNSLRSQARRKRHERSAAVAEESRPIDAAAWDRWQAVAHEEIDRLPDSLRTAFVICVVQGVRQTDAATQLGWRLGTVSGRVCKAKQALAAALTKRGLVGPAVLAAALGGSMTPLTAGLANKGIDVVVRGSELSKSIHELARGAMGGMMFKLKLLAAIIVVGTLSLGVGTSVLSTADAQSLPAGAGPAPKGPPPGSPGAVPGMSPMGPSGGGGIGGMSVSAPRVEYHFVEKPKSTDAFKKLLIEEGAKGWEYVGTVPGETELIFKRLQRVGGMSGGMGGMAMPGMPGIGGVGSTRAPSGTIGPATPAIPGVPGIPGPGGPGGIPPMPGAGAGGSGTGATAPRSSTISIQVGETLRYRMASSKQIDRVLSADSKIAEVALDLTDSKRVLIKGVASGNVKLELTDADGTKETYTIRVK